jgi:hypothetical protein
MKWPCKECIVRPMCSQECQEYRDFMDFMVSVISPIIMTLSVMLIAVVAIYLTVLNDYNSAIWFYIGPSWLTWILIQDDDSFFLTLFCPALLPGYFILKLLARKYKRA